MKSLKEFEAERTEAWEAFNAEFSCDCEQTVIRERTIANGSLQYVAQCLRCGRASGNAVKRAAVAEEFVKPFDLDAQAHFEIRKKAASDAIKQKFDKSAFFTAYDPYLASPEWARKRALVFARAKGTCEGCGTETASEVHHLTYTHVGQEFLFQLVALCHACHERFHDEK